MTKSKKKRTVDLSPRQARLAAAYLLRYATTHSADELCMTVRRTNERWRGYNNGSQFLGDVNKLLLQHDKWKQAIGKAKHYGSLT